MTDTTNKKYGDLAAKLVTFQGDRDFVSLKAASQPDVVLDFPYWPTGPQTFTGVDMMIKQFSVINVFQTFKIDVIEVFDTGGDTVIVEGRSVGTYKSGRPDYTNHYLFVLSFRDGKLSRWREFFNPLEAMKQNLGKPRAPKSEA